MRIHATLATLGVPTADGRMLAANGDFTMSRAIPITYEIAGIWVVGQFDELHRINGITEHSGAINELAAAGTLFEYEAISGMAYEDFTVMTAAVLAGRLSCQLELGPDVAIELGEHMVVTGGTVTGVRLDRFPAWPGCTITQVPAVTEINDETYDAITTEYQRRTQQ